MSAWLRFWEHSTAGHQLIAFALVAAGGLALGRLKIGRVSVGIAGVLFAGLVFARSGVRVEPHVLEFTREFGLILFVFSIGLQLGPGFFSSLRRTGLKLNLLAAGNVLLGVAVCVVILRLAGVPLPVAAGLLSGATTNTPSLAAAQQALIGAGADDGAVQAQGVAYALAYPFGVCGVILAMLAARRFVARPLPGGGASGAASPPVREEPKVGRANLEVRNPGLAGATIADSFARVRGLNVSRLWRGGALCVPAPARALAIGDQLLVVGLPGALAQARMLAGGEAERDLRELDGPVNNRRVIVTRREAVGKNFAALQLQTRFGVAATRLSRHGMEFAPEPGLRVQFGDILTLVGASDAIAEAARLLGDSPKELDHTRVGPFFFGILLGVLLGMAPVALPGLPAPARLGLAGGPLVVAILLGRLGGIGPVVWHVPPNAGLALREIGIVLFLACVGLKSGDMFFQYLFSMQGLGWMALGAVITLAPVMGTAWMARRFARLPLPETCGLLAGAMTDPPALAFARQTHGDTGAPVAYATVYPLVMLLRVLAAQMLVFLAA
ncbi:MAG: putative transporter [Opitutaceae bacterium]|jgi:putative transport protein|nr:putative transporter [Opitutaceae bacterium]